MQVKDDHADETTYAGRYSHRSSTATVPDTSSYDMSADRNAAIYSYVTLVAERCHTARINRVDEVNNAKKDQA